MAYFSKFQKLMYDLKGDGTHKLVPDIFRRIKLRSKVANNISLLDTYDLEDGEKPEDVAFKIYNDTEYHWVVLLVNNITNRYHDWPLSNQAFEKWVFDKYDNPQAIHHYEKVQSSGTQISAGPEDYSHMIEVNSTEAGAGPVTNAEYERRIQDKKRQIRVLAPQYLDLFIKEFRLLIKQ